MSDRAKQAHQLRLNGLLYREIAHEMGISIERVRQLVDKSIRISTPRSKYPSTEEWLDALHEARNLVRPPQNRTEPWHRERPGTTVLNLITGEVTQH